MSNQERAGGCSVIGIAVAREGAAQDGAAKVCCDSAPRRSPNRDRINNNIQKAIDCHAKKIAALVKLREDLVKATDEALDLATQSVFDFDLLQVVRG